MKKTIVLALITSFFLSSCSHSFIIAKYDDSQQFYNRINSICSGKDEIILRTSEGQELKVNDFTMSADSSRYINLQNNNVEFVNTNSLKEMEYKVTWRGIFDGALLGCTSGFIAGALISLPFINYNDPWKGLDILFSAGVVGSICGVTGAVWGGIHQSTIILDLQQHQNPKGQK